MAGLTPVEIEAAAEAAVQQFVQSSVQVTTDVLGPIDVGSRFDEVVQLFSSTLIFDPNSLFYLIYLSSNKLCADVIAARNLLADVRSAIDEVKRKTTKVSQTTLLGDAAAALTVMGTILVQNSAVSEPPYTRYVTAVDSFRDVSLSPNIKSSGTLVRSPQEAKASAITSLTSLRTAYPDILNRANVLLSMVDQYIELNLPVLSLQQSLSKARNDLVALQKAFEDPTKTEDQKIAMTKDAYFRITAGKSVITNLRSVRDPTSPRMQPSVSTPLVGALVPPGPTGTFTSAAFQTGIKAPWAITPGLNDTLIVAEDGNAPTTYTIPTSPHPSVESFVPIQIANTYPIGGGSSAMLFTGDGPFNIPVLGAKFYVTVDGVLYSGPITEGPAVSADTLVIDFQNLTSSDSTALSTVVNIFNPGVSVTFSKYEYGPHHICVADSCIGQYVTALGFAQTSVTGTDANNLIVIDTNNVFLGNDPATPTDVVGIINTWATTASKPYVASVITEGINQRIRITKTTPGASSITMNLPPITDSNRSTVQSAYAMLGFFDGQTDSSNSVSASELSDYINGINKVKATVLRVPGVGVTDEFVKIESKLVGLSTRLVVGAGTANALLGVDSITHIGSTTGFTTSLLGKAQSFSAYDVEVGDLLIANDITRTIGVIADTSLDVDSGLPFSTAENVASFTIISADYLAYSAFISAMDTWMAQIPQQYLSSTQELDRLMNPLLGSATPTDAQVADAINGVTSLDNSLYQLYSALILYVVRNVTRIDAALNMLVERGLDLAYSTLMDGDLLSFFSYNKDDASTAAYMLKTMRALVQNDLPVSKISESLDDTSLQSSTIVNDANFDFSDGDKDENIKLLGSVPTMDTDASVAPDFFKKSY